MGGGGTGGGGGEDWVEIVVTQVRMQFWRGTSPLNLIKK